ncbi:191L [Invertebrate iridescent virus Kaz2018]|nr:191L [Invertebrate iridescent virus Kaz2018]
MPFSSSFSKLNSSNVSFSLSFLQMNVFISPFACCTNNFINFFLSMLTFLLE